MIQFILKKIIGSKNVRELKKLQPKVNAISELEPKMKAKSDDELKAMTAEFKQRLDNGAPLDDLLIEAFAVCRETGRRVLNMRHYDVQLVGGIVQHGGAITEMKTGEGKTLVATLPLYLNALTERGCHLVTVNDYLASRDAEWMGKIYNFLGLSVGVIYHDMPDQARQKAYRSDITYGQNNEFGFDYLRDNMKESIELYVQRELNFAIVDEVDSILIDEARTPLIISGPAEQSADLYHRVNQVIPSLKKDVDYTVDEKGHSAMLTDTGVERVEKRLAIGNLYDPTNLEWLHNVTQALRAHTLYKRDVNYLVDDGKVIIIDEFTGRKMPGRRWSDGLHQAVEAKENVTIEEENQTLATITFQNYFRMYNKLAGMTGTAETEAEEFFKIYKLDVSVIPTNKPMIRNDHDDVIYKSEKSKFKHVIEEIKECHKRGQPVLVGTISVEKSEVLSKMLRKQGIKHNVLNAKNHGREAEFVAQAGRKCALTLSTNMAGRGTDIVLGGNAEMMAKGVADPETEPEKYEQAFKQFSAECKAEREEVLAAGGMHILGTERYEARRVDNQLRGRAGRQGDPGTSRFYLSLEDDLLRIFGAERIQNLMDRLGMEEDERIEHKWVNKAISNAQKKVEGHNFDIRKHLLEYDNVMNQQRKTIYSLRKQVLEGRYAPELSDAEKKAGKQPKVPEKSGEWTVEKLSETLRPRIKQILDDFYSAAQDGDGSDRDPYRGAKGKQEEELPETAVVDHEELTRELYRFFGAMIDLLREAKEPRKCLNKATKEIAKALIQQRERILDLCDETIGALVATHCPVKVHAEEWSVDAMEDACKETFNCKIEIKDIQMDQGLIAEKIWEQVEKVVEAREEELGPIYFLYFARHFFLEEIDNQWIEHLKAMDHLREGIGLRGYGQRDPKQEYKKEGYNMFAAMMDRIQSNVIGKIFRVQVEVEDEAMPEYRHKKRRMSMGRGAAPSDGGGHEVAKTVRRSAPKIGRNDPCPCGSGKKYKKCCMARDQATS